VNLRPPSPSQSSWYLLTGLILGLGLGLVYAWVISPVKFVDTAPASLRADFKDQYRNLIATAYQDTGDLDRAESRLALLDDLDPVAALSAQAQRLLLAGDPSNSASSLALLARAIQQDQSAKVTPNASSSSPTPSLVTSPANPSGAGPALTLPPHPTPTPSSTPGAPFAVLSQDPVCDPSLPQGLLQVEVRNSDGGPVPGAEIVISWSGGDEDFFTGLKPELGKGYADYKLTPGQTYAVQLVANSATASNLTAPTCPGPGGKTFPGGIHLVFQQPKK